MITALDHIAIAVPDLEGAIARFLEDFGLQHDGNEVVEAAQTTTAFFSVPETHIELVHPLDGAGPIATYLEKRGGGLLATLTAAVTCSRPGFLLHAWRRADGVNSLGASSGADLAIRHVVAATST